MDMAKIQALGIVCQIWAYIFLKKLFP
jgi:hypothetical protein